LKERSGEDNFSEVLLGNVFISPSFSQGQFCWVLYSQLSGFSPFTTWKTLCYFSLGLYGFCLEVCYWMNQNILICCFFSLAVLRIFSLTFTSESLIIRCLGLVKFDYVFALLMIPQNFHKLSLHLSSLFSSTNCILSNSFIFKLPNSLLCLIYPATDVSSILSSLFKVFFRWRICLVF
jgi:hypothetical protein